MNLIQNMIVNVNYVPQVDVSAQERRDSKQDNVVE